MILPLAKGLSRSVHRTLDNDLEVFECCANFKMTVLCIGSSKTCFILDTGYAEIE